MINKLGFNSNEEYNYWCDTLAKQELFKAYIERNLKIPAVRALIYIEKYVLTQKTKKYYLCSNLETICALPDYLEGFADIERPIIINSLPNIFLYGLPTLDRVKSIIANDISNLRNRDILFETRWIPDVQYTKYIYGMPESRFEKNHVILQKDPTLKDEVLKLLGKIAVDSPEKAAFVSHCTTDCLIFLSSIEYHLADKLLRVFKHPEDVSLENLAKADSFRLRLDSIELPFGY